MVDVLDRVPARLRDRAQEIVLPVDERGESLLEELGAALPRPELPRSFELLDLGTGIGVAMLVGGLALRFAVRKLRWLTTLVAVAGAALAGGNSYLGWVRSQATGQPFQPTDPGAILQDARRAVEQAQQQQQEMRRALEQAGMGDVIPTEEHKAK